MLPANEYERIFRTHGRAAADAAADQSMADYWRRERRKMIVAGVIFALLAIATYLVS